MEKPKVLVFIDWFYPAFKAGGPIQSVANLVAHLGSEMKISIVTSDRDLGDKTPMSGIELNKWIVKENYLIIYVESRLQTSKFYTDILLDQEYDYVYLNSLFSVKFTLLPLWVTRNFESKIILATRGMLGLGALNIKKGKKKVFLLALRVSGCFKKVIWHATGEPEALEIKKYIGDMAEIRIAPNFTAKNSNALQTKFKRQNQLNLFFLGRVSEVKNLIFAIELLMELNSALQIEFTIIGPIGEESYWEKCQQLIKQLSSNIKVVFMGPIPNKDISKCLENQHFLLLPTFHENFGHVFIESWSNGCPVIISDQTPWRNLEVRGIGWDISLEAKSKFIKAIEEAASMNQEDYSRMSEAAFDFAKCFRENPAVLEANRKLFNLS